MNQDKAREFFSAHYEETLEAGLKQSFEARLKADALLRSEYASFVSAMESLDFLRDEEIEIPQNLSSKIATRLEEVQEKRAKSVFNFGFFRPLAFGGLACLALAGAVIGLRPGASAGPATGSLGGSASSPVAAFEIARENGVTQLRTREEGDHSLTITTNGRRDKVSLNGAVAQPLANPNPTPAVFHVRLDGATQETLVVVPGTSPTAPRSGEGTMEAFAVALSGVYSVPVAVTVPDSTVSVRWDLKGSDAQAAASEALSSGATVDLSKAGVLTIQGH